MASTAEAGPFIPRQRLVPGFTSAAATEALLHAVVIRSSWRPSHTVVAHLTRGRVQASTKGSHFRILRKEEEGGGGGEEGEG